MEGPPSKRWRAVALVLVLVLDLGGLGWCGVEGCWEEERVALLQLKPFFNRLRDPVKNKMRYVLYNWVEDINSDCCKWEGVECDATNGKVIGLSLPNRFYLETGSAETHSWFLNASLFLPFDHLKSLNLSGRVIQGCLPNHGFEKLASNLNKLEVLDLSVNDFDDSSILSSLMEFSSLKFLNLSYNSYLTGPIHTDGLSTKLSLETLDLRYTDLDNSILLALSEFPSLKYLDLSFNRRITGSSHGFKGLSRLTSLETLYLNGNYELGYNILSHLGNLSSLKTLGLESCGLGGTIQIQELNSLINLKELYLSNNRIESFGSFLEDEIQSVGLINLEVLSLTLNILNNSILSSLGPFSKSLKHLYIDGFGAVEINSIVEGSIDFEDARERGLKNLKDVDLVVIQAANNSLLAQSLALFPSLKSLHFKSDESAGTPGMVILEELRNLIILEELLVEDASQSYALIDTNILEDVGKLTSLRVLSLKSYYNDYNNLSVQGPPHWKNLESLRISHIFLENNFLDKIRICELTSLKDLVISESNLTGTLPDCFSNLISLRHLDLSSNQLLGNLSLLESLTSMESIDLSNNQFQIPSSLKPFLNHSKLKHFNGDYNHIFADQTELHYSLAPKFQLNSISLSCCGNGGALPKFLHHQHVLQHVCLSNINLTGEFPSWLLENNTQLETLFLPNNSLSGHLSFPFHPSIKLYELDISRNFFDGHIPIEIGRYLPGLTFLNMSINSLDGGIPSSIGDIKFLAKLDLSNNRLSGIVPESLAMNCSSLTDLVLSNNHLQGHMFSSNFNLTKLVMLQLAGNNFTGQIPNSLANCSVLLKMDIGDNHISGRIPPWIGNLSSLEEIIMLNNHIEGPITKEFCQLQHLKLLDLSMNNISGTLPSCFRPEWINHLHLSKNRLRGSIPNSLCNSSQLVTLDLSENQFSGNIPECIGELSELGYLVLKHNKLEGEIPRQLCQLELSLIDLSQNNLSGVIPPCLNVTAREEVAADYSSYGSDPYNDAYREMGFGLDTVSTDGSIVLTTKNISYSYRGRILRLLSGINLAFNKLTGNIPHEMGNLHTIIMLNLSHNNLSGAIPPSLSKLGKVESLDFSYNNLSGSIPPQFVELYSLAYFNVSYNNLSGKPPPRTAQFATDFDENSYWGNPLLCGEPLPKNCSKPIEPSSSNSTKVHGDDQEEGGFMDIESFFQTFAVSYIMVLLGIAAVLYINPYWRQAWFYFIESFITTCFYFVIDNLLPRRFRFFYI